MGTRVRQMRALLWKNFSWFRRHPYQSLTFILLPLIVNGLLNVYMKMSKDVMYIKKCVNRANALFPSHPDLVLHSQFCTYFSLTQGSLWPDSCTYPYDPHMLFMSDDIYPCNYQYLRINKRSPSCWYDSFQVRYNNFYTRDFIVKGLLLYWPNGHREKELVRLMEERFDEAFYQTTVTRRYRKMKDWVDWQKKHIPQWKLDFCFPGLENRTKGFPTRDSAMVYMKGLNLTREFVWGMVEFRDTGPSFKYKLLSHVGQRLHAAQQVLVSLVESAAVRLLTGSWSDANVELKPFPSPCTTDPFVFERANFFARALLTICMISACNTLVSRMCEEKVAGLLELLLVAGVPRWVVRLGWLAFGLATVGAASLVNGLLLKLLVPLIIQQTSLSIVLLLFLLFALSLILFCFFLASLLHSAERAGGVGTLLMVLLWVTPDLFAVIPNATTATRTTARRVGALLHPALAGQVALAYIMEWEKRDVGVTLANVAESPLHGDSFGGVAEVYLCLLIQIPVYLFLAFYMENVFPGKYGLKQSYLFFISPYYWGLASNKAAVAAKASKMLAGQLKADVEEVVEGKPVGICIENLNQAPFLQTKVSAGR